MPPKKADGLVARDMDRPGTNGEEFDEAPGVNVLAAGLGLNSKARTLNLVDAAEVGVCALFGLVTLGWSAAGPVGGKRASLMGRGAGTGPMAAPFRCWRLSARRWPSMPVAWRPCCMA